MNKFKDQEALQKAYESLEKEFTRRSQRLRELQGKIEQGRLKEIPKNAVALTREEYVENGDMYIDGKMEMQRYYDEVEIPKVKKETAEKFAERLKEKLNEWLEDHEDDDGKIDFGIAEIELIGVKSLDGEIIAESFIDEIAKEITDKGVQNGN